ncbi:MAG: hypothetical protein LBB36_02070 [Fibromonadaceae bacterium]|jgi:hypothetical protein|nr:hypothetical protein [Fibromonadaceae bacterium]
MENNSDRIEISTNKKGAVILILIVVGINIIFLATGRVSLTILALSAIAAVYTLSVGVFKKNCGLVIDNNGITDNVCETGLIRWDDIEDIEIIKLNGFVDGDSPPRLAIYVRNPKDYLYSNRYRRELLQNEAESHYDKYGTPILIHYALLTCKGAELQQLLAGELEKRKK